MRIQIINGPNINLLGKREPSIYGSVTFEDYLAELRKKYADVQIDYFQSNIEGELIDKIQQVLDNSFPKKKRGKKRISSDKIY